MVAEDVPPAEVDARIAEWAQVTAPEAYQARVAGLIGAPVRADAGQPAQLALSNSPSAEQFAAEAAAMAPQVAARSQALDTNGELPPAGSYAAASDRRELAPLEQMPVGAAPQVAVVAPQVAAPENFEDAFREPAPTGSTVAEVAANAIKFVSSPTVQAMPVRQGAAPKPAPARVAKRSIPANGSHLVQLGSFSSEAGARRAWGIYVQRYSQLSDYDMVITEAKVRGKTYFRVSAGGFQSASAKTMCGTVKANGQGCIAWAEGKPLPGAIDNGVRMARR